MRKRTGAKPPRKPRRAFLSACTLRLCVRRTDPGNLTLARSLLERDLFIGARQTQLLPAVFIENFFESIAESALHVQSHIFKEISAKKIEHIVETGQLPKMATFASTTMSKNLAEGEEAEEPVKKKYEPKKLHTSEVTSLFNLKSEYLKKKNDIVRSATGEVYRGGKSSVLAVNKEEKVSIKKEAQERKRRINEHEAALRKEEQERLDLVRKKLKILALKIPRGDAGTTISTKWISGDRIVVKLRGCINQFQQLSSATYTTRPSERRMQARPPE
ncbi:hypothetical protein Y032_0108g21 [Ancylostoma ceylanicum]|uniref:Uncharacterized protein n=1 Tax=Ancylostoma ceylanicum TaxID=53326 RepID=A0A016TF25_9BILA|nr:hypothetical protein Y032_0108g21 [Ancylostoma ceylanicum]